MSRAPSHDSRTPSAAASRVSSPAPSGPSASAGPSGTATPQVTDIYRPIAAAIQKPLADLTTQSAGDADLPTLLGLDNATYSSRLSGKSLLLCDVPSTPSELVTGRKRNRGDPAALEATKAAQAAQVAERAERGTLAPRKAQKIRKTRCATSPSDRISYDSLAPLRTLHERYLAHVLQLPVWNPDAPQTTATGLPVPIEPMQGKLLKTDLTGAVVSVIASKNPSLTGIRGTILEETSGTLRLACADDHIRVVPKQGAQFLLRFPAFAFPADSSRDPEEDAALLARFHRACPQIEIEIMGSAFAFRSGDRAGRKFRPAQGKNGSGWGEDWVKGEWGQILEPLGEDVGAQTQRRRKRGKSRRKDPLVGGNIQVF